MVVTTLLFLFYTAVFVFILYKSTFIQQSNIPFVYIICFFVLKILAGCFYGYVHYSSIYNAQTDTWKFYYQSLVETKLLKQNPSAFLQHIFSNGYDNGGEGLLATTNSYWNDLKHNVMLFLMSLCNLFTASNYYVNIIFYNAVTFFGLIAFYRFCVQYVTLPKTILIISIFCVPSFVFWSSGFHKEGLLFTAIAFILYSSMQLLHKKNVVIHIFSLVLCIFFILILRNYILLFFIPMLLVWVSIVKLGYKCKVLQYAVAICILGLFFFNANIIHPKLNLPLYTATAQLNFLSLNANTKLNVDTLQPTIISFVNNASTAFNVGFLQPIVTNTKLTYLPSIFDNIILVILIILNLYYYKKGSGFNNTSLLFLSSTILIFIFLGYTVPIVGAIIRYKAIYLPFLYIALLQQLPWNLWQQKFNLK